MIGLFIVVTLAIVGIVTSVLNTINIEAYSNEEYVTRKFLPGIGMLFLSLLALGGTMIAYETKIKEIKGEQPIPVERYEIVTDTLYKLKR